MEKFTYQKMYDDELDFWWYVARRKILNSVLNKLIIKKASILEVGSGTGGNVSMLKKYGSYLGIEKEQTAIEFAHSRHPEQTFEQVDVPHQMDKMSERFSLIVMLDVIEHIEEDLEALEKTLNLLDDGGVLIITTPAFPFLWSAHDDVHHHYRRYTKKQLLSLVEKAGFKVEYHSFFNFFLFPVAFVVKVLGKILGSKKPHKTKISKPSNWMLEKIFSAESKIIPRMRLPFGVSHLMVLSPIKEGGSNERK